MSMPEHPLLGNLLLLAAEPASPPAPETFDCLLEAPGIRIERIVSQGHRSPLGFWYDQPTAEWVVLISGAALLQIEGIPSAHRLAPGDWIHLPAHCRHRVEWTDPASTTIWLAVHFSA